MMLRLVAPALMALTIASGPVRAFDLTAMTDAERDAFGAEVRGYLLENPHVILEVIELLERNQAAAAAQADLDLVQANAAELFDDGYSWVGGNPDGDITLVEFMDYRCGYCRRAAPEVASLLGADGNIRLIIKEFPILGEASVLSSRFAIAARHVAGDDAYKLVHDALLEFGGDITEITLRRLSDGLGLETDRIIAAMDGDAVSREIAETRELAQRLQISGTPTFVVETEMLRGFLPADQMKDLIDQIRAERG